MYWTICVIVFAVSCVLVWIAPFSKWFRENYASETRYSPFESAYLIESYIHGKTRHYSEDVSEVKIMFMYVFGNIILGTLLSFCIALLWPLILVVLIAYALLRRILTKIKNSQK